MITDNDNKALQLAKKVFEHFTHDALPIAREIISLERELSQDNEKPDPSTDFTGQQANDPSHLEEQSGGIPSTGETIVDNPSDDLPF
jgi:hypothetical protein